MGSGFIADHHLFAFSQLPNVEVTGIATLLQDEGEELKKKYNLDAQIVSDYQDLLSQELDAVSICLPNFLHEKVALAAFEADMHILVEKPLARNVKEGLNMVASAQDAGKQIFYCENNMYAPAFTKVKTLIEEGALGNIYMGRGKEQHSGPHSEWFYKMEPSGGGALIDLGVHDIACLLWFMDDNVSEVFCQTEIVKKDRGDFGKCEVEDVAVGILYFENGAHVTIEESWLAPGGYDMKFELYGDNGQVIVDPCRNNQVVCYSESGYGYAVEKASSTKGWTFPVPGEAYMFGYPQEMAHFVDCMQNNKKPLTDGVFALEVQNIIETMYKSAKTRKVEEVPSLDL